MVIGATNAGAASSADAIKNLVIYLWSSQILKMRLLGIELEIRVETNW